MTTDNQEETTLETTLVPADLDTAIAQAVSQHQHEQAAQAAAAQAERQTAEQKAIARFQLPFDQATLNALPTINFKFEDDIHDLKTIGWFSYQDLTIEISEMTRHNHCETWEVVATRHNVIILETQLHVYALTSYVGHTTPEQRGQDFLVFLHEAANTPTPVPTARENSHFGDYAAQKYREKFVKAAMQGTLMGLTHTGLNADASTEAALFAIETAERVLALMDATPVQRQVLGVLTLERFTEWLHSHTSTQFVGTLDHNDHPVCRYLQHQCDLTVDCNDQALYDESGNCVLGHDNHSPVPHKLPLDFVGDWLPALLEWKTFDPDTDTDYATFTAQEVLRFLEPYQR